MARSATPASSILCGDVGTGKALELRQIAVESFQGANSGGKFREQIRGTRFVISLTQDAQSGLRVITIARLRLACDTDDIFKPMFYHDDLRECFFAPIEIDSVEVIGGRLVPLVGEETLISYLEKHGHTRWVGTIFDLLDAASKIARQGHV